MKNNRLLYILIIILGIWCTILSTQIVDSSLPNDSIAINQYEVDGFSTDFTKVADELKDKVVTINADGSLLSGFVYKQEGEDVYVLSAYHGLSNVKNISVRFGSSYVVQGELVGHDLFTDLALVRIKTPYEIAPVDLGDSSLLKQGEFVIAIGTPLSLDYEGSIKLSMVAKNNLQIENIIQTDENYYDYFLNVIEISDALAQGYSGSPLINMGGEVVGMVTMSYQNAVSFALSINEIKMVADTLLENQTPNRRNLDVKGTFLSQMHNYEKANLNISLDTLNGLYVERLKEDGIAFKAGVRQGDVITKIDEIQISDLNSYLNALYFESEVSVIEYMRNGELITAVLDND